MKNKRSAQPAFVKLRVLLDLLLCAAPAGSILSGTTFFHVDAPAKASQRVLTFAERVALQDYWQQPITSEQLQAEINRMAKHTKQPAVLRELVQALGNDPLVVAECLARPILADRLFTSALAYHDVSWGVSQRTRSPKTVRLFPGYTLPTIATGLKPEGTCFDAWGPTSATNAPAARVGHTAVWTGSEMIVWGGYGTQDFFLNTGEVQPYDRYVDVDRLHQRTCATGLSHGSVERQ